MASVVVTMLWDRKMVPFLTKEPVLARVLALPSLPSQGHYCLITTYLHAKARNAAAVKVDDRQGLVRLKFWRNRETGSQVHFFVKSLMSLGFRRESKSELHCLGR